VFPGCVEPGLGVGVCVGVPGFGVGALLAPIVSHGGAFCLVGGSVSLYAVTDSRW